MGASEDNAISKAQQLVDWLRKQDLTAPVELNKATVIPDVAKYVDRHADSLKNTKVLSSAWRGYYRNLHELKQHYASKDKK